MKEAQIVVGNTPHQKAFFSGLSKFMDIINKELSKKYSPEPLGKHIKILGGHAFKSTEYKSEGIPVIRISDFQDEKIDLSTVQFYEEKPEYDKYQLSEGDIILALTGGTIGKLGIVQKGLGKLYLNQRVGKFSILHPKEFCDQYIYWLARGIQEKVKSFGYGGAQPNISGSQIEEILFPIPDKKIQEKIVEFLEDLKDGKLKNKEYFHKTTEKRIVSMLTVIEGILTSQNLQDKNLSYLAKLRASILQSAVRGELVKQNPSDEPASILLKKIKAEKEKLIKEGKIRKEKPLASISDDEKPYELPRGWEWARLGEICEEITDIEHKMPKSKEGGIKFISAKDIGEKFKLNLSHNVKKISEEDFNRLSSRIKPEINDIIYSRIGTVGKVAIVDTNEKFLPSYSCCVIRVLPVNLRFLAYYLQSGILLTILEKHTRSIGVPDLGITAIKNFAVGIPPLSEQIRIVEKVDKLMDYCDELEKQVKENQENAEKLMGAVLKDSFR